MGRKEDTDKVSALLGDKQDDATAKTADLTELAEDDSSVKSDDIEAVDDFAVENRPRPPLEETLFGGDGELERLRKRKRSRGSGTRCYKRRRVEHSGIR